MQQPDPEGTARIVHFSPTEAPAFIRSIFMELEHGGTVALGVENQSGAYAFARISKADFLTAATLIAGKPE